MAEKHSEKTDNDMLDQTFGSFDTQMTDGPETAGAEAAGQKESSGGAKKSQNLVIAAGMGGALVLFLAYSFIIKPMLSPAQIPQVQVQTQQQPQFPQPVNQASAIQQGQVLPQVNVAQQPQPQVQTQTGVVVADNQKQVEQTQQPQKTDSAINVEAFLSQQNKDNMSKPHNGVDIGKEALAQQQLANTNQQPQAVQPAPVVQQNQQTASQQVAQTSNVQEKAVPGSVVEELKMMFDRQNTEMRAAFVDIGTKIDAQTNVNKSFDERLTALEAKLNEINSGKVKKQVVQVAKSEHVAEKKRVEVKPAKVVRQSTDEEILIDKTVAQPKVEKVSKRIEKEEIISSFPEYKIHSIFSGRVWFKNSDGTLATYQEGERLPSGELIKKINTETFDVETDKRKIGR